MKWFTTLMASWGVAFEEVFLQQMEVEVNLKKSKSGTFGGVKTFVQKLLKKTQKEKRVAFADGAQCTYWLLHPIVDAVRTMNGSPVEKRALSCGKPIFPEGKPRSASRNLTIIL